MSAVVEDSGYPEAQQLGLMHRKMIRRMKPVYVDTMAVFTIWNLRMTMDRADRTHHYTTQPFPRLKPQRYSRLMA